MACDSSGFILLQIPDLSILIGKPAGVRIPSCSQYFCRPSRLTDEMVLGFKCTFCEPLLHMNLKSLELSWAPSELAFRFARSIFNFFCVCLPCPTSSDDSFLSESRQSQLPRSNPDGAYVL